MLGIFGNIKNMVLASFAIFGGIYIAIQKYKAFQAESKLLTIENKIAKTNIVIAKAKAKAKAKAVKAETKAEVDVLRSLKKEAGIVEKEMQEIEIETEKILQGPSSKVSSSRRRKNKKVEIEV
jgi:hypothetical protein